MAANKSDTLANRIVNHILRATASTAPTTVYAALFTVAPTKTTFGTEVSGGSYARVDCGATGTAFDAPTTGATANSAPIAFPTASASWGLVVACAIVDHITDATAANILYFGNLTASKTVDNGDTVTFATGALTVAET
jgi:hypothetical protein